MTEPERAALDHIRQVVDSVLGVTAPPEPPPPGLNAGMLPVSSVIHAGNESDQFTNDSGAAAIVLLLRAYIDQSITISDFYHQINQSIDSPLSFTQILNVMGANGVPVELRSNLKLSDMALILFSGRPVITPVNQSILPLAGPTPETFDGPYFVVVVGMDVKQVFIYDPLSKDTSGQPQGIPWLTFYKAWSQAQGYERAVLVPHQPLVRRVRVTASMLEVFEQPGGADASPAGTVSLGELLEVTQQKNGWGKIGEDSWINLSYTADI